MLYYHIKLSAIILWEGLWIRKDWEGLFPRSITDDLKYNTDDFVTKLKVHSSRGVPSSYFSEPLNGRIATLKKADLTASGVKQ